MFISDKPRCSEVCRSTCQSCSETAAETGRNANQQDPKRDKWAHIQKGEEEDAMEEALFVLARPSSALPTLACSKAQKHVTVFYLGFLPPLVYDCLYLTHRVILIFCGRTSYSVSGREIIWILSPFHPCHAKEVQCGYRHKGSTFQGRA